MFDKLKTVIVGAAAIVALIPGATLAGGFVEMPIQFDKFLGLLASVIGPVVFFLIYLSKDTILRFPRKVVVFLVIASTISGVATATWLFDYSDDRIKEYPYYDNNGDLQSIRFILPEKFGPELERSVQGRNAGILENALKREREATLDLLARDAKPARRKMILGFLLTQALFIFGFLLAAWATIRSEPAQPQMEN